MYRHMSILYYIHHLYSPMYHHMSILYYIHHLYSPHVPSHVNIVLYSPSVQPSCTVTCQYCIISTICTVPMYRHMSILYYIHHLLCPHVPSHVNIVLYPPSVLSPCTVTCQYCIISTLCTVPMYRHMSILYYIHPLYCPHVPSHVNIVLYPPSVLSPCTITCQYCIISTICTALMYHHMSILYYIHHLYSPHVPSHVNIVLYPPSVQPSCTITCQYCIIFTICTVPCTITCQYCIISTICTALMYHHMSILYYIHHLYSPHVPSHVNIVLYSPSVQPSCTVTCQYCIISTICTVPMYHHMSIFYYIHHLYCPHVPSHVNIVLYPPSALSPCTITCQYCIIFTICTALMYRHMSILYYIHHLYSPMYHHMSILYYIHHLYSPHVPSHVNIVLYSPSVQTSCTVTCQYCIISTICTVPMYRHMSILYYIHHLLCPHVPSHVNIVLYPPSVLSPCTVTCQYCIISTLCTVPMYRHMSILYYIHPLYCPHVPSHVNIVLYPPSVLSPCTITCQYCIISTICTALMYHHMSILYYIHHLYSPHVPSHVNIVLYSPSVQSHVPSHVNIVLYPPSVQPSCTITCQYCIISTICTALMYHHMSILYYIHHLYSPHVPSHVNIVLYPPSVLSPCTITCQYCIISTICTVPMYRHMSILYYIHHLLCPHVPSHVNIVLYSPSVQPSCTVTCQYCIIFTICTVPCTITCQYCIISTICTALMYHHMSILYYIHHLHCPHVPSHVNIVLYPPSAVSPCTITCQYCIISTICTVPMYRHMSILYYIHHLYCPRVPSHVNIVLYPPSVLSPCTVTCQYCIISTICTVLMYHHMSILYYIHHLYCPHVPSHVNIVLYPPSVLSPCTITCQYCIISTICTVPMYCHMSILCYIHHLYSPHVPSHVNIVLYPPSVQSPCTITCQYCIISTICTVPMYHHMSILYYIHHLYSPHVPSHVNIVLYPPSVLSSCTITCQYCIISTICIDPMYCHISILNYIHHLYCPHVQSHVNIVLYPPSVLSQCTITCQYCIISTICTVPMYRHMSILYYIHHLYCPNVPSHVNIVLYPPSVQPSCTITCQYCIIFTICTALM